MREKTNNESPFATESRYRMKAKLAELMDGKEKNWGYAISTHIVRQH